MKYAALIFAMGLLAVVGFTRPTIGATPVSWTGEATTCGGSVYNEWSNDANWDDTADPTSGIVHIRAFNVCDPCDDGICVGEWCGDPPCPKYCAGGPHNGEECETTEECETDCVGGYWIVSYDYAAQPQQKHTFSSIKVEADSDHSMELQKDDNMPIETAALYLYGHSSTYKAILDMRAADLQATNLYVCGDSDIIVDDNLQLDVTSLFKVGCGIRSTLGTLTGTASGSGTVDVSDSAATVCVHGYSSYTATLDLDDIALDMDELQVYGGDGSSQSGLATFQYGSSSEVTSGLYDVVMRGYSKLDVSRDQNWVIQDELKVESVDNGNDTEAEIHMPSGREFSAARINITSNSSENDYAKLTIENGTLACSGGTLKIEGNVNAPAELEVLTGTGASLKDIELYTRAALDLDEDVDIATNSGTLTIKASSTSGDELQVHQDKTFIVDKLVIDASDGAVDYTADFGSGAVLLTES